MGSTSVLNTLEKPKNGLSINGNIQSKHCNKPVRVSKAREKAMFPYVIRCRVCGLWTPVDEQTAMEIKRENN